MELGELNNIFTVSADSAQVNWAPDTDGDSYHMYFITQQTQQPKPQEEEQE